MPDEWTLEDQTEALRAELFYAMAKIVKEHASPDAAINALVQLLAFSVVCRHSVCKFTKGQTTLIAREICDKIYEFIVNDIDAKERTKYDA